MSRDNGASVIEILALKRDELNAIARKHGAKNIRVFGSVARREETSSSDIDLLVDMDEDASLLDLARLKNDLEDLLGRTIDITTKPALHPLLAEDILKGVIAL
ncbi:polymerase beta, Nucleotidyltransferase [anaerobic digester metagenome]